MPQTKSLREPNNSKNIGTVRLAQDNPEQDSATTRMGRVQQVSFTAGALSLNEESEKENLQAMKILDEYANILRGVHRKIKLSHLQ